MTVVNKFENEYKRTKDGALLFASDFAEFNQEYIGDLLAAYVKEGKLLRLANGVYLKAAVTRFGPVYPSPTEIAVAIARRDHAKVLMAGVAAENYFGLSTQVPMKMVFLTSGSARKLKVGNMEIVFKRGVPKNFAFKDEVMASLCLALKSIGNGCVTDEQRTVLKRFMGEYIKEHNVNDDLKLMPQWIRNLLKEIIKEAGQ